MGKIVVDNSRNLVDNVVDNTKESSNRIPPAIFEFPLALGELGGIGLKNSVSSCNDSERNSPSAGGIGCCIFMQTHINSPNSPPL